jgi:hypothetical protein
LRLLAQRSIGGAQSGGYGSNLDIEDSGNRLVIEVGVAAEEDSSPLPVGVENDGGARGFVGSADGMPPTLILDWLYRQEPDELERVRQLCAELGEEVTERQHALQEKATAYVASLAATAIAEYATVTPAGLRALADLLERAASEVADELAQP